jgi:hypothetical protein
VLPPAERYEAACREIRELLAEADPEGLLGAGAPANEYDDSVARLAREMLHGEPMSTDVLFGTETWAGVLTRAEVIARLTDIQRRLTTDAYLPFGAGAETSSGA